MRIAQVAPLYESVPPKLYGGTERVVSYLTEELVRLGHEVTLFASGDSKTSAELVPACARALWHDAECRETLPWHLLQMELLFRSCARFDVIHFHTDHLQFPFLRRAPCANVTTLHGRLRPPDVAALFEEYRPPLVSISDAQRAPVPGANWQTTIHHGLPRGLHRYSAARGEYLVFLGRFSPEKRVDRAIEIARRAGVPLKIAARIYPEERAYFREVVEPLLDRSRGWVEFLGEVGGDAKDDLLRHALALLFPIDWPEPFGLVMIEAMACGTPVIAWRNGSVPEVVTEGVTGFIVEDLDDAVRAVARVGTLERSACRECFERRFDATRMAHDYVRLYERLAREAAADASRGVATPRSVRQSRPLRVIG